MSRIRSLVDLAYNNDPRIVKFRNEDKEKKQAAKRARMSVVQAAKAEEERVLKEAQLAKEKAELAEQKRIEQIRLEKEQQKRALKKERKLFRDTAKEQNYYSTSDKEKIRNMEGVEKICEMLKTLELQSFNKELAAGGRDVFIKVLKETEDKLEEERKALFDTNKPSVTASSQQKNVIAVDRNFLWSPENMQLLIKAVNLFPAGTVQRWEVTANYLNQHGTNLGGKKFIARDVLNKAKDLQSSDFTKNSLKSQANDDAFASFQKSKKELKIIDQADISVNDDDTTTTTTKKPNSVQPKQNGVPNDDATVKMNGNAQSANPVTVADPKTWTKDEQALLEQAMKTFPISTPERWDRIAECIPNRTKKDCLRRVKELVDRVNAKRDAQQIVK